MSRTGVDPMSAAGPVAMGAVGSLGVAAYYGGKAGLKCIKGDSAAAKDYCGTSTVACGSFCGFAAALYTHAHKDK
jgi:hypothetical protein